MLILLWASYASRTFIFTTTPREYPQCLSSQYFNDPTNAIADGYTVDQLLAINSDDQLEYRRPPKEFCVPGDNQVVTIRNPQYCLFTATQDGQQFTFEGKNHLFDTPFYTSTSQIDGRTIDIITNGNCKPQTNTDPNIIVTDGTPLKKWN